MGHPPRILSAGLFACLILLHCIPAFANTCTVGCHGLSPGKGYQEGQTYVYNFEGTSVASVSQAQGESTLSLKADVELTVKPNCVRQLRIKNAQINGAPIQLKDVEQHALQFNYHNGHIDTEVCAEPGDSQASLNIKRAIASLFQTAVTQESGSTTHFETDVFGGCVTNFNFQKDGDNLVVKKERNLVSCRNRESLETVLVSAVYNRDSPIQSNPILAADLKVEQNFKAGILNRASAVETYKFVPFSNGDNGAQTVVKTTLTFNSQKGDVPDAKVSLPKSLIFEAPHPVTKSSADAILEALKKVKEEETEEGVKASAAQRVAELTKVLRVSNKKDILSAYQRVKSDKTNRKVLLDSIYKTGTGEAAEAAVELIKSKELTPMQTIAYYFSLAIVRHVNLPSVAAITSLLDQPDLPRIGYLGVGQIIGKYCQQHSCDDVPEVKKAIAKIVSKIGNGKADSRKKENEIVAALKALGNTRYIDDENLKKIASIATDKSVRNRVRVAAIEALPTRCSEVWEEPLGELYGDYEEDAEVRIKAYLSLVACACPQVGKKVSAVLDNEKSNQVGSFVTSHLRNLRASADPNKSEAKRQLGQIHPRKRFPEDFRKFSFNNEFSYNFPSFGTGDMVESNVIYSQNSFVPRSVSFNLTSEVFGRSFNFVELETRIENLDHIIEQYFGPMGEFIKNDPKDLTKNGIEKFKSMFAKVMQRLEGLKKRTKRDVKHEDLNKFAKGVVLRENEVDENVDIDLSVKLFGIELAFLSLEGSPNHYSPENIIDKIFDGFENSVDKLKDFNYNVENHLQFLDAEGIYPTGLGLPLSIGAVGTGVVHMKTSGKIDLPAILKDPKNAFLKIALEPSVSIRVASFLRVKGLEPNQESGIKHVGTLHSSTGADLSVKLLEGKGIDISVGIPKKKQELINVESEVLINNGKEYVAPKFGRGREHSDCFDQFSALIGVTICGNIAYPYDTVESVQKKPLFPLSGPAKFAVTIENNDVSSFHFRTYYDTKNPKSRSFEILLETPNSRTNRKVSLLVEGATEPDKFGKITLESPLKKASIEGRLRNTAQEKSISITASNDQNEYFFKTGLMSNGNKYKPILEYKVPEHVEKLTSSKPGKGGAQAYNVEGSVDVSDVDGGKKFVFDKVVLKGSGREIAGIDGSITSTPTYVTVDGSLTYGPEKIVVKADAKKIKDGKYSLDVTAVPTKSPEIGFAINYEMDLQKHSSDQKLVITHGPDLKSEVNRITIEEHIVTNFNPNEFKIKYDKLISYPASNVLMKLKYEMSPKCIEGDIEMQYEKFKLGTEFKGKVNVKKVGDYELEFEAEILQNKLEFKSQREIIDDHKSKFTNSLELSPGGKYSSDVTLDYDIDRNHIHFKMDGDVNLNGKKVTVNTGLDSQPQKLNSEATLTFDGKKYIEFVLKLERGDKPNGKLILNLKNYLTANGQFNYAGGKGNAQITVDIPKINRKIKGTSDLTVTGTQHVANVEILYDAEKDPSKRLKLTTVCDITKTSLDTKNVIQILSYKIEVNANGKIQGKPFIDGQANGEIDITLPDGRNLIAKGKYNVAKKGDTFDYEPAFELIQSVKKGGESQKLSYSGEAKNVDYKAGTYEGKHNLKYVYFDGKDIDVTTYLKRAPGKQPGRKDGEIKVTIAGAAMPRKFNFDLTSDIGIDSAVWDIKSSLGDDLSLKTNTNYVKGERGGKPYTVDSVLEVTLPFEKLKNFKVESHDALILPVDLKGEFERKHKGMITYNDDKKITTEVEIKKNGLLDPDHASSGSAKVLIGVLEKPPYGVDVYYKHNVDADRKHSLNLGLKLSPIDASGDFEITRNPDWSDIALKAKGKTNLQNFKSVELDFKHKNENENKIRKTDIALTADDKKYALTSEIKNDPVSPSIDVTLTTSEGITEIKFKNERIGEREFKTSSSIKGPKGFVTLESHVKLESEDNFMIEVNIDSNKLKQRKIHAEVAGTANPKNGKRIHVTVTSDGKNLLSGSMNFNKREEGGKIIIDGSGELKVLDATRSSSFKYSRQRLTKEEHGEQGIFATLHANFDPSAIVSEVKFTDKEALFFGSYCEKSKDCTQMKLQSKLDTDRKTKLHHQVTVEANLRKLNVPLEFGFRSNMKYERSSYDHLANLYLHSTKDKSEYGYHAYWNLKESGVVFNTPNRELALISTHELPKSKHTGAYKMETALYLDRKNKPNDKTGLIVNGDVNIDKSLVSLNGEAKFVYPAQSKDMMIKGKLLSGGGDNLLDANVDIDVFAKKAQKINIIFKITRTTIPKGHNVTSNVEINSRGQQLKVDLKEHFALSPTEISFGSLLSYTDVKQNSKTVGGLFSANLKEAHLLVQGPNQELVNSHTTMELSRNLQKIDNEFKILDNAAMVTSLEAKDWNTFNFVHYHKDSPKDKLTANGRIVLGQLTEFHANNYVKGEKKNLFSVLLHLDESNFLKPEFSYDKDNIVAVGEHTRHHFIEYSKQLKEVGQKMGDEVITELKDLLEHLKKAQPNFKPLVDYYQTELKKLKDELHADATVQEIEAVLKKTFGALFEVIAENVKQMVVRCEELYKQLCEFGTKLAEALKTAWPQIKASIVKVLQSGLQVLEAISNLGLTYLKAVLNVVNEHQKELKEIITVASELAQDVAKMLFKAFNQIEKDVKDFVVLLIQQLKALPIYDIIKEKYQEVLSFQIPEAVLGPIQEVFENIKYILPTKELKDFAEITYEYIIKLVRRQKVDDVNELKKIYSHAVSAVQSILKLLQNKVTFDNFVGLFDANVNTDLSFFKQLPSLVNLKVSVINLIINRETPSVMDIYYAFRPTLHIMDVIPPFSMSATVTNGHIFSYDGRHVALQGSCNYILSQDIHDGNFSVVGEFDNGILLGVTVTDPKESITIKPKGVILYNNKPSDFPLNTDDKTKDLHAFYTPPSVHVKSRYGLHMICTNNEQLLCNLHVSGFYLGRLRGLFGDGNNEPYDDFTLPSGKVTENDAEFINAYKLNPSCPDVAPVDHKVARAAVCTEFFSGYSSMSKCFNYVDPSNWRHACDHAIADGRKDDACLIAVAYFAACREKRVFVNIPQSCSTCTVGPNEVQAGNDFSVKIPKKSADIIFVVEQESNNEKVYRELVVPLISELKNELKQQGMTDVFTGLIGFGEKMRWPQHYTSNGNRNIEGEVKNMYFADKDHLLTMQEAKAGDYKDRLKFVKQRMDVELGTFKLTDAYEQAIKYPFRPGSAKAVVGVIVSPCEKSPLPISLQQVRLIVGQKTYRDLGLTYYHLFNTGDILVSGKEQKNIVGYDYDSAFTFADAKKKPLEGSTSTRANLELSTNDVCAGFAVSSGGAAFSTRNFIESKPNQKKQYLQVAARRIAEGLASLELEEDCTCYQYHGLVGRPYCKIVNRKEKEHRHKKV